jgi:hypothetical protein
MLLHLYDCLYFQSRWQVLVLLDLNGSFSFPLIHQRRVLIESYSCENISAPQPGTSLFAMAGGWLGYRFLTPFDDNTDDPDSQYDHGHNRCNKGVPLSRKL